MHFADKPVKVILADGSDFDWERGSSGQSGQMFWEYFRISGSNTYWLRMRDALLRVDTDLLMLLDDEDSVVFSGITHAAEFLLRHHDYAAAGGIVLNALSIGRRIGLSITHNGSAYELSGDSYEDRLERLFLDRRSAHLNYQIYRTRNLRSFVNQIVKLPTDFALTHTVRALPMFIAMSGKWKALDVPFLIRRQIHSGGKTYSHPSTPMSEALCHELAVVVSNALSDLNSITWKNPSQEQVDFLAQRLRIRYTQFPSKSFTRILRWRQLFAKSILFGLFDKSPQLYGLLRPRGLKTVAHCSHLTTSDPQEVFAELFAIEQLWTRGVNR